MFISPVPRMRSVALLMVLAALVALCSSSPRPWYQGPSKALVADPIADVAEPDPTMGEKNSTPIENPDSSPV